MAAVIFEALFTLSRLSAYLRPGLDSEANRDHTVATHWIGINPVEFAITGKWPQRCETTPAYSLASQLLFGIILFDTVRPWGETVVTPTWAMSNVEICWPLVSPWCVTEESRHSPDFFRSNYDLARLSNNRATVYLRCIPYLNHNCVYKFKVNFYSGKLY